MRKQLKLIDWKNPKYAAGGGRSHLKRARPFVPRRPLHIVLRSDGARDKWNMLRHAKRVAAALRRASHVAHVQLLTFVNVGNHLHLKVRANSRESLYRFHRAATSLIARAITGARRGVRCAEFFTSVIYKRVLSSRFEEKVLPRYFRANRIEASEGEFAREQFMAGSGAPGG